MTESITNPQLSVVTFNYSKYTSSYSPLTSASLNLDVIRDVYKTWTGVHGPPHGPGPWTTMDHPMDQVHGPGPMDHP